MTPYLDTFHALNDSCISHDELVLVKDVSKEFGDMKKLKALSDN